MMTTFAYRGRTRAGEAVRGERVAETIDAAVAALRGDEILVATIDPVVPKRGSGSVTGKLGKRVPVKNLSVFTRQF